MQKAARMRSRAMGKEADIEELKVVAIFCGAGLLVSLLAAMSLNIGLAESLF